MEDLPKGQLSLAKCFKPETNAEALASSIERSTREAAEVETRKRQREGQPVRNAAKKSAKRAGARRRDPKVKGVSGRTTRHMARAKQPLHKPLLSIIACVMVMCARRLMH